MSKIPTTNHFIIINGVIVHPVTLDIQVEEIDVTSLARTPDRNWQCVDRENHFHGYSEDNAGTVYPTLRTVYTHEGCTVGGDNTMRPESDDCDGYFARCPESDDCDGYFKAEYQCRVCSEVITPGTKPPSVARHKIPGKKTWHVESTSPLPRFSRDEVTVVISTGTGVPAYFGIARFDVDSNHYVGVGPLSKFGRKAVKRGA